MARYSALAAPLHTDRDPFGSDLVAIAYTLQTLAREYELHDVQESARFPDCSTTLTETCRSGLSWHHLEAAEIRVDIDDRDESVGKRTARSETDLVPYYVVGGGDGIEGDTFGVNVPIEDRETDTTLAELSELVTEEVGDLPRKQQYPSRHVSDHPSFTGS